MTFLFILKNSIFVVCKGKLVVHIISKHGNIIDKKKLNPSCIFLFRSTRTECNHFPARWVFRRFVPNFDELLRGFKIIKNKMFPSNGHL
jgi:hypothetical protein